LLVNGGFAAILSLGDNQYYCGVIRPSWNPMTQLGPGEIHYPSGGGNHEYLTSGGTGCDSSNIGAAGYFQYFGSAAGTKGQGYYSFDVGAWHLIALNSNCSESGGCTSTSPQYQWLQADLSAHPKPVHAGILAYPVIQFRWARQCRDEAALATALQRACRSGAERA